MNANYLKIVLSGAVGFFMAWALFSPVQEMDEEHDHEHEHHHHHDDEVAINDEDLEVNGIQVVKVKVSPVAPSIESKGKLIFHPDRMAHVLPKVSGVVQKVYKKKGDSVTSGDTLALLESKEIAEQKAAYLSSLRQEAVSRAEFERQARLFEKGISSQAAYSQANLQQQKAKIDAELSKQKLLSYGMTNDELGDLDNESGDQLRIYRIKAPISGLVIERHLTQGEYVEDADQIFQLADLSTLWVELGIPSQLSDKLKEGQAVDLTLSCSNEAVQGKIIHISPFFDEGSITVKAIAEVSNPKGVLCPGAFATGSIQIAPAKEALMVPVEAVQELDGEVKVFVRHADHFVPVKVVLGSYEKGYVEVMSGLSDQDEVAANGSFLLKADLGKEDLEHEH